MTDNDNKQNNDLFTWNCAFYPSSSGTDFQFSLTINILIKKPFSFCWLCTQNEPVQTAAQFVQASTVFIHVGRLGQEYIMTETIIFDIYEPTREGGSLLAKFTVDFWAVDLVRSAAGGFGSAAPSSRRVTLRGHAIRCEGLTHERERATRWQAQLASREGSLCLSGGILARFWMRLTSHCVSLHCASHCLRSANLCFAELHNGAVSTFIWSTPKLLSREGKNLQWMKILLALAIAWLKHPPFINHQ
jgi:hypothetical protein